MGTSSRPLRGHLGLVVLVVALTLASGLFGIAPFAGGLPLASAHPAAARVAAPGAAHDIPIPTTSHLVPLPAGLSVRAPAPLLSPPGSTGPTPSFGPGPAFGSANNYIADFSTSTSLAPGANNRSLAAALQSGQGFSNGTAPTANWGTFIKFSNFFWSHGFTAGAFTTNGGNSWTENWLTLNSTWTSSCTTHGSYCGDINAGEGYVAGNGNGLVLMAEDYGQTCDWLAGPGGVSPQACNNTLNFSATDGIAVARSTDGGASWAAPAIINSAGPQYTYLDINWSATGCPGTRLVTWLTGNQSFEPVIAVAPGGTTAVVTWSEESVNYAGDIGCNAGNYVLLANPVVNVYQEVATTTDGGKTWGNVQAISDGNTAPGTVVVGPAPHYIEYLAEADYNNQSGGQVSIDLTATTNNGTTWSTPTSIPTIAQFPVRGFGGSGVGYPGGPQMQLAVDATPTSSHFGNLYLIWADNRSARGGQPSVAFSSSTDGGNTWSSAVYVTPNDASVHNYMIPKIAVDGQGALWIDFYAWNVPNSNYIPEGVLSQNAGATWSAPFGIATATSVPFSNAGSIPVPFGDQQGLVGTTAGTYAAWMDCRFSSCTSPTTASWDFSAYSANLRAVTLSSNAPGVNVTVTALGTTTVYPAPGSAVFELNASVTAQVPSTLPDNASYVWGFTSWTGATTSASNPTTFTFDGSSSTLTATYTPQPGAWISGIVSLEYGATGPRPTVSVAGIGNLPIGVHNATSWQFNATVTAGPSYTIQVTAGSAYYAYSQTSGTSPHVAVNVDTVLKRTQTYINGTVVVPAGVNVTGVSLAINGTPVAVNSAGGFTYRVEWGSWNVSASLAGYSGYSHSFWVNPGQPLRLSGTQAVTLFGGTLVVQAQTPANMLVEVNGAPLTLVNSLGTLAGLKAGLYTVTATAKGYSYYSNGSVNVTPQHTTQVTISLTNKGWITGTINPANGSVEVAGTAVAVNPSTGAFNVSVTGGRSYLVLGLPNINDPTHVERNYTVTVSPGNVTTLAIQLNRTSGSSNGGCPPNCANTGPMPKPTDYTWVYLGIGAVVVAVAALAVVLLLRRKPGAGASSAPGEIPESTGYDGSNPGELPKLQPDGSMGPGEPPA